MGLLRLFTLCTVVQVALSLECGEFSGYSRAGYSNGLETRIVNGELASLGEFPWQISMQRRVRAKVQGVVGGAGGDAKPAEVSNAVELTEDEVLDNSMWGRFLWPQLAAEKNITYEQGIVGNWPPPIPTHAPGSQTFPPLPTHPPSHRLPPTHPPGSQTYPPLPPMPTFPPQQGAPQPLPPVQRPPQYPPLPPPLPSPLPPRPRPLPTQAPTRPSQYPPLPTLPPSSARPNPPVPTPPPQVQPPRPRPPVDRTQKWQHFCGGSIIDKNWILTASHCLESLKHTYTPGTIRIVAGSINWRNFDERAQVIPVDRIIVHDGWTQQSGQNDVALMHLQSPLEFVKEQDKVIVNKICLSRLMNREHTGMATSSGWGFLSKDQRVTPDLLRRVDIPIVDHNTCRNAFSRVIGVTQMQVCAGQAPKGNCMGDSGSPLIQGNKEGNKATQIGIVSFSIPCAVPGYPDVFTRVSKYLDWIITHTGIPF